MNWLQHVIPLACLSPSCFCTAASEHPSRKKLQNLPENAGYWSHGWVSPVSCLCRNSNLTRIRPLIFSAPLNPSRTHPSQVNRSTSRKPWALAYPGCWQNQTESRYASSEVLIYGLVAHACNLTREAHRCLPSIWRFDFVGARTSAGRLGNTKGSAAVRRSRRAGSGHQGRRGRGGEPTK